MASRVLEHSEARLKTFRARKEPTMKSIAPVSQYVHTDGKGYAESRDGVTVYQTGDRWGWCKRVNGCGRHSSETFASEWSATLAAASIAQASGLPLRVSKPMRDVLAEYWRGAGWNKFDAGQPRDTCRNQYERYGWDEANAVAQEQSYILASLGRGVLVELAVSA